MRKNVKEPLMERRLIVNMTFERIVEREADLILLLRIKIFAGFYKKYPAKTFRLINKICKNEGF